MLERLLSVILLSSFLVLSATGQSIKPFVISPAGGTLTGSNGYTIRLNMGEILHGKAVADSNGYIITQGFLQPEIKYNSVRVIIEDLGLGASDKSNLYQYDITDPLEVQVRIRDKSQADPFGKLSSNQYWQSNTESLLFDLTEIPNAPPDVNTENHYVDVFVTRMGGGNRLVYSFGANSGFKEILFPSDLWDESLVQVDRIDKIQLDPTIFDLDNFNRSWEVPSGFNSTLGRQLLNSQLSDGNGEIKAEQIWLNYLLHLYTESLFTNTGINDCVQGVSAEMMLTFSNVIKLAFMANVIKQILKVSDWAAEFLEDILLNISDVMNWVKMQLPYLIQVLIDLHVNDLARLFENEYLDYVIQMIEDALPYNDVLAEIDAGIIDKIIIAGSIKLTHLMINNPFFKEQGLNFGYEQKINFLKNTQFFENNSYDYRNYSSFYKSLIENQLNNATLQEFKTEIEERNAISRNLRRATNMVDNAALAAEGVILGLVSFGQAEAAFILAYIELIRKANLLAATSGLINSGSALYRSKVYWDQGLSIVETSRYSRPHLQTNSYGNFQLQMNLADLNQAILNYKQNVQSAISLIQNGDSAIIPHLNIVANSSSEIKIELEKNIFPFYNADVTNSDSITQAMNDDIASRSLRIQQELFSIDLGLFASIIDTPIGPSPAIDSVSVYINEFQSTTDSMLIAISDYIQVLSGLPSQAYTVVKTSSIPDSVKEGQLFQVDALVENVGTVQADSVRVLLPLPPGFGGNDTTYFGTLLPGDTIHFSTTIQAASYIDSFFTLYILPINGNGIYTGESASIDISQAETAHDITINQGWNLISSYVSPDEPKMELMFDSILSDIILVKNAAGNAYFPSFGINTIGDWDITQGYKVKAQDSTLLTINGLQLNPLYTPISLEQGWSAISYLNEISMSAEFALDGIVSSIILVKNNAGNAYFPSFGINTIGTLDPGEGYKIKMQEPNVLIYPEPGALKGDLEYEFTEPKNPVYFTGYSNTGENATIIIPNDRIPIKLQNGDEIGIFNSSGLLAGAAVYQGESLAVTAWGDDITTDDIDGLTNFDEYEFKVWDHSANEIYDVHVNYQLGESHYSKDGISIIGHLDLKGKANTTYVYIYPNPVDNKLVVDFASVEQRENLSIRIVDLYGKEVIASDGRSIPEGQNIITIDVSDLSSGLYICEFRSRSLSISKKIQKH